MPDYIQLHFKNLQPEQTSILVAELSELGFEGFEEVENFLNAFIAETDFNEQHLQDTVLAKDLPYTISRIEETNWNAQWESGFQPVQVDDFVAVRAGFHTPVTGVTHEIVITPKMSFGTGHHATTYMMLQQMRSVDFNGKRVADYGTGTGILAILAEKLGATSVLAIDNDDWSISNTLENLESNHCTRISCRQAETLSGSGPFDIILANINKNVILDQLPVMYKELAPGGILVLSGLLESDQPDIYAAVSLYALNDQDRISRNNWTALRFSR